MAPHRVVGELRDVVRVDAPAGGDVEKAAAAAAGGGGGGALIVVGLVEHDLVTREEAAVQATILRSRVQRGKRSGRYGERACRRRRWRRARDHAAARPSYV